MKKMLALLIGIFCTSCALVGQSEFSQQTTTPTRHLTATEFVYDEWLQPDKPLQSFFYGSCNKLQIDSEQNYWNHILSKDPDLFFWLGDIVYPDAGREFENLEALLVNATESERVKYYQRMEELRSEEYDKLKTNPNYQKFIKSVPVRGIWDDHDYAYNNADGTYPMKQRSANTLLEFLNVPQSAPQRGRSGNYFSLLVGPKDKLAHFIVLDLRYNFDRAKAELLGEEQWIWFKSQLLKSPAQIVFIMSSLNVHNYIANKDNWATFPAELERLSQLLAIADKNIVILSGDSHYAAVSSYQYGDNKIYELISSGITHTRHLAITGASRATRLLRSAPAYENFNRKNIGQIRVGWRGDQPQVVFSLMDPDDGSFFHIQRIQ